MTRGEIVVVFIGAADETQDLVDLWRRGLSLVPWCLVADGQLEPATGLIPTFL
jgi:hypothetical protein